MTPQQLALAQLFAGNPTLFKAAMQIASLMEQHGHGQVTVFVQQGKTTHFEATVKGK